ncbi:16S rRNA (guanine(966)-N(2))-methyltransferase RsmD [Halanaerobacter jeridensis]|uniref:16S rRNA (Guanine966-N2)-methyltransferase n=1 Tax=Halanaerobacter jeridensis TaxID=706427 RepID=A0A939BRV4_9FIRM|nr:16S rRNA (guanine(966)-N(2))-methyltransferase RsmD [Halanaerobacter jeridensis]MBM7556431.1 16S rRNA (guanine966-N2)-methyltransferase [Halanaerobacter jeridensis]
MRIIAGKDKGRRLNRRDGQDVRPTSDRTKEALFNILGSEIVGVRFLDLFAGFGGIGLEALSRGAYETVFVDKSEENIKIVEENIEMLGYEDKSKVVTADVLESLGLLRGNFDLIFMDPPYKQEHLYQATLKEIEKYKLLHPTGIIIMEHHSEAELDLASEYDIIKERDYGNAALTLVKRSE